MAINSAVYKKGPQCHSIETGILRHPASAQGITIYDYQPLMGLSPMTVFNPTAGSFCTVVKTHLPSLELLLG